MSNIIETYKYLNEQKKRKKAFPHYGLKVWYGGQGERKNNICSKRSNKSIKPISESHFYNKCKN